MNASIIEVLFSEGVQIRPDECCVCYEHFIEINCEDLWSLYVKKRKENKSNVEKDVLFYCSSSTVLNYDDRFECFTCKNKVCYGCNMRMTRLDDKSGVITCPVCKTEGICPTLTKNKKM